MTLGAINIVIGPNGSGKSNFIGVFSFLHALRQGRLEWRHKGSDSYFGAESLSDGTLRFLALATLFLQPEEFRSSVILVDEPELGLHPLAVTMLASLVKQAAVQTQVILSTQSPLLLDHFEPEDVLVADRELQAVRDGFRSPEEINDSPETAPSKRVARLIPGYEKPLLGTLAALEIGLAAIRDQCPKFREWLTRLENWPRSLPTDMAPLMC